MGSLIFPYFWGHTIKPFQTICYLHPYHSCVSFLLLRNLLLYFMIMLQRLESIVGPTSRITHFSVLLRSNHQTLSNHMLFASLPCKGVLFVVTRFVALLYDNVKVGSTSRITHFPVVLRSHHQILSNHMPFAALPCKPVLFAITEFVALLYDSTHFRIQMLLGTYWSKQIPTPFTSSWWVWSTKGIFIQEIGASSTMLGQNWFSRSTPRKWHFVL